MKGFSIIICCYNSQNKIVETLEHIMLLKTNNILFEVLVIDNGSNDLTKKITEDFLRKTSLNYKILEESNAGKANALLKGFTTAQYDKIVICDDDVLLNDDYLMIADKIYNDNPEIGILGGKGILKPELSAPVWFNNFSNAFAIGSQWECSGDITQQKGYIWGAGSIINQKALSSIKNNGFKTFYTGVKADKKTMTGEDSELCIWVTDAGYKLFYDERLVYIHNINIDRANWKHLVQLNVGFSRSQVYLDLIKEILVSRRQKKSFDFNKYISKNIKKNFQSILKGFFSINYFKSFWISYIEKREGYIRTLSQNNYYYKIKEYLTKRKALKVMYDSIG